MGQFSKRIKKQWAVGLSLLLLSFGSANANAEKAEIKNFSPEGTVKEVRQVKASFSVPMVAFGDPKANVDPFDMSCPGLESLGVLGRSRWADAKHWVYDFAHELPGGIQCTFKKARQANLYLGSQSTNESVRCFESPGSSFSPSQYA
jgi:hypothetical protein